MDALRINIVVATKAVKNRRSMAIAWVDNSKAFDRVPQKSVQIVIKSTDVQKVFSNCLRKNINKMENEIYNSKSVQY